MKKILNKLIRNEEGQALILALILLVVGGLIIAPLLGFMSTGLIVGQLHEKKMNELYAADAGVELGLWYLMYGGLVVPEGEDTDLTPFTMNNKTVNVNIFSFPDVDTPTYRITSMAGGTIIAHVTNITLHFTDDLGLGPGDTIGGNVYVEGNVELHADAEITGNVIAEGDIILNADAVIGGDVCAGGDITLNADTVIEGSVYAVGDVTLNGRARIEGNVSAGGDVTLYNNAIINGDAYAGGNVLVDGSDSQIIGDVHICPPATVSGSGSTGPVIEDCYMEGCPLGLGGTEILSWEIS